MEENGLAADSSSEFEARTAVGCEDSMPVEEGQKRLLYASSLVGPVGLEYSIVFVQIQISS